MKLAIVLCGIAAALPSLVQAQDSAALAGHALGADIYMSRDADDTQVVRAGLNADWTYTGPDDYLGLRVETVEFEPLGQTGVNDERVYLRYARRSEDWSVKTNVGTDGDTILGSASINNAARFRQEYFVERDILETPRGLDEGIYYTFAGAALDVPVSDRLTLTGVVGLQDFTGDNLRTHLRLNVIQVIKEDWGLSAQLRTRYFEDSDPGEFDYFSPEWYVEVMPILQLRRRAGDWRYLVAAGVGAQRNAGSDWRSARYFNTQITTPQITGGWVVNAGFIYSNTPVASGYTYDYSQATIAVTRAF